MVDDEGGQLGVMPIKQALELADEQGLDLVEVAPTANPPVCRIMDYGKFRYEATRKEREAKKARKSKAIQELREVRMKTRLLFPSGTAFSTIKEGFGTKLLVFFFGFLVGFEVQAVPG